MDTEIAVAKLIVNKQILRKLIRARMKYLPVSELAAIVRIVYPESGAIYHEYTDEEYEKTQQIFVDPAFITTLTNQLEAYDAVNLDLDSQL